MSEVIRCANHGGTFWPDDQPNEGGCWCGLAATQGTERPLSETYRSMADAKSLSAQEQRRLQAISEEFAALEARIAQLEQERDAALAVVEKVDFARRRLGAFLATKEKAQRPLPVLQARAELEAALRDIPEPQVADHAP